MVLLAPSLTRVASPLPSSAEVGEFMHACEGEAVCKLTNAKVRSLRLQPRAWLAQFRARKSAPPTGASQSRASPPRKRTSPRKASAAAVAPPSPSPRIEPALTPSVPPTPPLDRARRCPTSTAPSSSRTRPRWARLRRSSDPSTPPCSPSRWRRASSRARTARAISSTSPPISSSRWSVSSRRRAAAAAAAAEDAEEDAAVAAAVVSAADADEDAVERVQVGSRSIARRSSPRAGTSARSKPNKATNDGGEHRASAPETPGRDCRRRRRRRRVDGRGATASTRRFRKPCNDEQQMSFHAATRRDGEGARLKAPGSRGVSRERSETPALANFSTVSCR